MITLYPDQFKINDDGTYVQLPAIQGEQGQPGFGVPSGGTAGQILTKASNTDYDTVWTKNIVSLWENTSTSTGFSAQKIPLDLSGYSHVGIRYGSYRTQIAGFNIYKIGEHGYLHGGAEYNIERSVDVDSTGVTFGGGYYYATYNNTTKTTNDNMAFPIEIIGINI